MCGCACGCVWCSVCVGGCGVVCVRACGWVWCSVYVRVGRCGVVCVCVWVGVV